MIPAVVPTTAATTVCLEETAVSGFSCFCSAAAAITAADSLAETAADADAAATIPAVG